MPKTYSGQELRDALIEIQDGAILMTNEQRGEVFLTAGIIEENQVLASMAKELLLRGHIPKHAFKTVFTDIAQKRNYFYFNVDRQRGIFIHVSRFDEVLKKIRDFVNTPAT